MRRSDREITDFQELITVMRGCDVCRLALHDEPYPYILPLNFGLEVDGETVRQTVEIHWNFKGTSENAC